MHLLDVLNLFLPTAATLIGGLILHRLHTPKDHELASHLATVANQLAAVLVVTQPNADWPQLLRQLITQITTAAGLDRASSEQIQAAATAALVKLGKKPAL